MKILVTGALGSIGKPLCAYLRSKKHSVYMTDIIPSYNDDYILSDVTKPNELVRVFRSFMPDIVFHLAALYGRLANERYATVSIDTNITGTNNIIQLCKLYNSKIIFFSSSEVYGNIGGILREDRVDLKPNNRYGIVKLMCEKIIQYEVSKNNLKAIILRPNMVYTEDEVFGEYRSAMIRFTESLLKNKKITVYKDSSRSWLYINDAVKIFEKCIYIDRFEIINIANPVLVKTVDMVKLICNNLNLDYKDVAYEDITPEGMTQIKDIDVTKMISLLGITPATKLEDGIKIVINKVKKRINE